MGGNYCAFFVVIDYYIFMSDTQNALKEIEQIVNSHPILGHRFLREFGALGLDKFSRFVSEQYLLSVTLPYALAHAYGQAHDVSLPNMPSWKIARPIMGF